MSFLCHNVSEFIIFEDMICQCGPTMKCYRCCWKSEYVKRINREGELKPFYHNRHFCSSYELRLSISVNLKNQ